MRVPAPSLCAADARCQDNIMYCEFSSLVDLPAPQWDERAPACAGKKGTADRRQAGLLRGTVSNTTPAGEQLTNIRKLVTGGGGSGSSSSSSSSSS